MKSPKKLLQPPSQIVSRPQRARGCPTRRSVQPQPIPGGWRCQVPTSTYAEPLVIKHGNGKPWKTIVYWFYWDSGGLQNWIPSPPPLPPLPPLA